MWSAKHIFFKEMIVIIMYNNDMISTNEDNMTFRVYLLYKTLMNLL